MITQEYLAACQILNVDPEQVLVKMGLSTELLKKHGLNLSAKQVATVFGHIVLEYGKDDFHIKLADGFAKAAFGHAFLALQCSENLRKGIHRVSHFKRLIEPVDWIIQESENTLSIQLSSISSDFPLVGIGQIMSFLWLVKCCRNITARDIIPTKVIITDQVPHQDKIENEIGCKIIIGAAALIEFPSHLMDVPTLSFNSQVLNIMSVDRDSIAPLLYDTDPFISSVYSVVLDFLPSGTIKLERVADRLSLSKRTFERRLEKYNISFNEILRQSRMKMASYYIHETSLPISEISLLIGYQDKNSFNRVYKDWFSCTPSQARSKIYSDS